MTREETEVEEGFLTKKSPEEIGKVKKLKAVKDREKEDSRLMLL